MNQHTCTRRLEALKELMVQQDMTDLLVTHPANRSYLSGFAMRGPAVCWYARMGRTGC